MAARFVVTLCLSALLAQASFAQFIGQGSYLAGNSFVDNEIIIGSSYGGSYGGNRLAGLSVPSAISLGSPVGFASNGLGLSSGRGLSGSNAVLVGGLSGLNVASSGPLAVTNISPIGPSGLAIASEIVLEGLLSVSGQLPFLSAVAFEGALPTAGSGVATCGCGNGNVGIISEGYPASVGPTFGIGSGIGGYYF